MKMMKPLFGAGVEYPGNGYARYLEFLDFGAYVRIFSASIFVYYILVGGC